MVGMFLKKEEEEEKTVLTKQRAEEKWDWRKEAAATWTKRQAEVTHRFLMCCREPRHLNCPFTMMARRPHSASHSSMLRNGSRD